MSHVEYKNWSKASIYLKAVRYQNIVGCLVIKTDLGTKNLIITNHLSLLNPICADVTIFKSKNHQKHYIHFLIDHFSKYIRVQYC